MQAYHAKLVLHLGGTDLVQAAHLRLASARCSLGDLDGAQRMLEAISSVSSGPNKALFSQVRSRCHLVGLFLSGIFSIALDESVAYASSKGAVLKKSQLPGTVQPTGTGFMHAKPLQPPSVIAMRLTRARHSDEYSKGDVALLRSSKDQPVVVSTVMLLHPGW